MKTRSLAKRAFRKAFVITVTAASPLLGCDTSDVSVNPPPPIPVECEAERLPMNDEPCATEGDTCTGGDCFGSPTMFAECVDGSWRVSEAPCNPPPVFDAGPDAADPGPDAGDVADGGTADASN